MDISTLNILPNQLVALADISPPAVSLAAPSPAAVAQFNAALDNQPTIEVQNNPKIIDQAPNFPPSTLEVVAEKTGVRTMGDAILDSMQRMTSDFRNSKTVIDKALNETKTLPSPAQTLVTFMQFTRFSIEFTMLGEVTKKLGDAFNQVTHIQ